MIGPALAALAALLAVHLYERLGRFPRDFRSPDALAYLTPAADRPAPFRARWLPAAVLGHHVLAWRACTYASTAGVSALIHVQWGPVAVGAFLALAMVQTWARIGVSPDPPAFALALGAVTTDNPWAVVVLALGAGACRETAPIFAALWAWSPWPLLGLLAVRWGGLRGPRTVAPPWTPGWDDLAPWGLLGPLAVLVSPRPGRLAATLAVAYAQCLIATDRARLVLWAAPAVLGGAASADPRVFAVAALSLLAVRYRV